MEFFIKEENTSVILKLGELEELKAIMERGLNELAAVKTMNDFGIVPRDEAQKYAAAVEMSGCILKAIQTGGTIFVAVGQGSLDEVGARRRTYEAAKFFFELAKKPFNKKQIKVIP